MKNYYKVLLPSGPLVRTTPYRTVRSEADNDSHMTSDTPMSEAEIAEQFEQFGLSEKEIDTYLAILDNGEAKASTVADQTGVSKRYVYSISERLEDRGFVDVNDHVVPTTIRARPPEEVVTSLTDQLEALEPALQERFSESDTFSREFDVIKSRVTVIKRLREYVDAATEELTLTIPRSVLGEIDDSLAAAADRGVLGLLVVNTVESNEHMTGSELAGLVSVVRFSDQPMPILLTVDNAFGLLAPAEMVLRSNSDQRSIAFVQEQLAPVLVTSFLGNYWPIAEEAYVTDPPELPRTYESMRNAVYAATLYLRDNDPIEATVLASRASGGEYTTHENDGFETISGPVVDTRQGLVEPASSSFASEHSLVVMVDGERVTVGGTGAFVEDFEAKEVTLSYAEDDAR